MKNLNMTKTAAILDRVLKVLSIAIQVGIVGLFIGLGFIAAYFLFSLEPWMVGDGYESLDLGAISLTLSTAATPDPSKILLVVAGELEVALAALALCRRLEACFRTILAPIQEGVPFRNEVSQSLKTAAVYTLIMGVVANIGIVVEDVNFTQVYDLPSLLVGDAITYVTIRYQMELNFLIPAATLLLLSFVFRYGESLQQLSDETL